MMDIWKAYIKAQEVITNQYSQPFNIKYTKSLENGKYRFKYIDNPKESIKQKITTVFKGSTNDNIHLDRQFFNCPISIWENVDSERLKELEEFCESNFFDFDIIPSIKIVVKEESDNARSNLTNLIQQLGSIPSIKIKKISKKKILIDCCFESLSDVQVLKTRLENIINLVDTDGLNINLDPLRSDCVQFKIKFRRQEYEKEVYDKLKRLKGEEIFFVKENSTLGVLNYVSSLNLTIEASGLNLSIGDTIAVYSSLKGEKDKLKRLSYTVNSIFNKNGWIVNRNLKEFLVDPSRVKSPRDNIIETEQYKSIQKFIQKELLADQGRLNKRQLEAISKSLLSKDMFVIQGPPGTGKSTAIAEIIWQHVRYNKEEGNKKEYKILVTSETNLAVDNALDKLRSQHHTLLKPIRFGSVERLDKEGRRFSLMNLESWSKGNNSSEEETNIIEDWIGQICNRSKKNINIQNKSALTQWTNLLSRPAQNIKDLFIDTYKQHSNVVGATCSSIGKYTSDKPKEEWHKPSITGFFRNYCTVYHPNAIKDGKPNHKLIHHHNIKFDLVLQDEASKASPPELALPCIYGKKVIIIGDHRQLPPMLNTNEFIDDLKLLLRRTKDEKEKVKIKELISTINENKEDFEKSHFEWLFNKIHNNLKTTFNLQYRMHPAINETIKQFYEEEGGLECGLIVPEDLGVNSPDLKNFASRYHGINIPHILSDDTHILWVDVQTPELKQGTSRINLGEVEAIDFLINRISNSEGYKDFISCWKEVEDQQIGVITFYGAQAGLLNDLERNHPNVPLRISPVDRFQGMERNIIIVSTVRSNCISTSKNQKPDRKQFTRFGYPPQKSLGFAEFPNRLNVALSRAKRLLIIVGNADHFSTKEIYKNVLQSIKNHPNGRFLNYNELKNHIHV